MAKVTHVYRSAITGKFVRPQVAQRHPRTTERETVYRPSPKPKKSS